MSKKLSILICSITERRLSLNRLLSVLRRQRTRDVEILVNIDNKRITTGEKRNRLLKEASGEYIAFVDDDDLVSNDYIRKILLATRKNPDCCGIEGLITFKKKNQTRKFIHSIQYEGWFKKGLVYYRCPNHISPVKRKLALSVGFPNKTTGEDKDYSMRLFPLLKTEEYIEEPIYYYLTG